MAEKMTSKTRTNHANINNNNHIEMKKDKGLSSKVKSPVHIYQEIAGYARPTTEDKCKNIKMKKVLSQKIHNT